MKTNMSVVDRAVRITLAVVVAVLYATHVISGLAAIILGIFALVFLVTSFVGLCPLYKLLGISTLRGGHRHAM